MYSAMYQVELPQALFYYRTQEPRYSASIALCAIGFGLLVKRFPFNVPVTSRLFTMLILAGFLTALFPAPLELYKKMHVSPWQGGQTFFEEGREGVIATFKKGSKMSRIILMALNMVDGYLQCFTTKRSKQ